MLRRDILRSLEEREPNPSRSLELAEVFGVTPGTVGFDPAVLEEYGAIIPRTGRAWHAALGEHYRSLIADTPELEELRESLRSCEEESAARVSELERERRERREQRERDEEDSGPAGLRPPGS